MIIKNINSTAASSPVSGLLNGLHNFQVIGHKISNNLFYLTAVGV